MIKFCIRRVCQETENPPIAVTTEQAGSTEHGVCKVFESLIRRIEKKITEVVKT